jgi:hypothetical protein
MTALSAGAARFASFRIHRVQQRDEAAMADKLSLDKALEKIRRSDPQRSKKERLDDQSALLDEEIWRMRAQRLRLDLKLTRDRS